MTTTRPGRSAPKRRAILAAAREVFGEHGYAGTSMDLVAARAGASKVTVYSHFADKQRLFRAVLAAAIEETAESTSAMVGRLGTSTDLEADLRAFARRHVVDVTRPDLIQLRRMVIAEAGRFPELARAWYRAGPDQAHRTLAEQIGRLAERGLLRAPDPLVAAEHLNYLILSVPVSEATFAVAAWRSGRKVWRHADEAVRIFLAAYGP